MSDEALQKRTGKTSDYRHGILDEWGAPAKGHTLAARDLREQHGLSPGWAQCVTIRYEWERGLRE